MTKLKKNKKIAGVVRESGSIDAVRQAMARGDMKSAGKLVEDLLVVAPSDANALYLQGIVYMQTGQHRAAIAPLRKALKKNPGNTVVMNTLAAALFSADVLDESENLFRRVIDKDPKNIDAVGNLGLLLQRKGDPVNAVKYLSEAAKQRTARVNIVEAWIRELTMLSKQAEVVEAIPQLLVRYPNSIYLQSINACLLEDSGQIEAGEAAWKKAQAMNFSNPELRIMRGVRQIASGNTDAARVNIDAALAINPLHTRALFAWATGFARYEKDNSIREKILSQIKESLKRTNLTFVDWSMLHFAAGAIADAMKKYDEAFHYFDVANKAIWERYDVSAKDYIAAGVEVMNTFTPAFFESKRDIINRQPSGDDRLGEGLIFIACMPRSGTTLTEQILSRGGLVKAGGERTEIDLMASAVTKVVMNGQVSSVNIQDITMDRVREIAALHHRLVDKEMDGRLMFSDKTPRNYYHFGVLYLLFPKATFINCVRNPVDTCLSCYFNYFQWNSVKYTYDLETLGVYFRTYEALMKHWRRTLPIEILDVVYEDLTNHPEEKIRELVTFCGLPWDEGYMETDSGNRVVMTASAAQVRQPLYKTSIERWKPYEKHLLPLLNALEADYTQFPNVT